MKITSAKNHNAWFDSRFYHLLYEKRDDSEAEKIVKNIFNHLNLKENAKVLDAACGKGRHSIQIEKLGYNVLGIDLSKNSINKAKENENSNLKFKIHDISVPLKEKFDLVLNLFTSFGYQSKKNDIKILQALHKNLNDDGVGVIDFLNVKKVRKELVFSETINKKNISFIIERSINKKNQLIKKISFLSKNKKYSFEEKVNALSLTDFKKYFNITNFLITKICGDYDLNEFDSDKSPRLILFFKKKSQSN